MWALGATLYYAVEGRPPYQQRDNPMAVLHDIAQVGPPQPRRAGPLEPVIARMLDRDPGTRWSMEDAAHALHRLAEGSRERTAALAGDAPTSAFAAPAGAAAGATAGAAAGAAAGSGVEDPDESTPAPMRVLAEDSAARRRPGPILVGVLALVAAVVALLLINPLGGDESGDSTAKDQGGRAAGNQAASSPRSDPEETAAETPEASPEQAKDPPAEDPAQTPEESGPVDASEATAFVDGYYDALPGDLDAGWAMLSPTYQDEVGRGSYDGFWGTIESVDAQDLTTVEGGDAVEATVVFVRDDGETITEQHRIAVVDQGDGLRVAGDDAG